MVMTLKRLGAMAAVMVMVMAAAAPPLAGAQPAVTGIDLAGLIPGEVNSEVTSVGPNGNVAGTWNDERGAFWWTAATGLVIIPIPAGTTSVRIAGVNANGLVAGTVINGMATGFTWSQAGGFRLLPRVPGFGQSYAISVNKSGMVAASGSDPSPFIGFQRDATAMAISSSGAQIFFPGSATLRPGYAMDVNDNNQIVGVADDRQGHFHPFMWSAATGTVDLGLPAGATDAFGLRIGANGQVVGTAYVDNRIRSFLWTAADGFTLLDTDGEVAGLSTSGLIAFKRYQKADGSFANATLYVPETGLVALEGITPAAVNSQGIVVGKWFNGTSGGAGVWMNSHQLSVDPAGTSAGLIRSINDDGLAGGYAGAARHAFLWQFSLAAPTVTMSLPAWVTALSPVGAVVSFTATSDNGPAACTVDGAPFTSGNVLAIGLHTFVCSAVNPLSQVIGSTTQMVEVRTPGAGGSGAQGPAGATGATGATGAQGPMGPMGPAGDPGPQGPMGPQGLKGDTGAAGPMGPQGVQGDAGAPGAAGPQGIKGDTGAAGPSGEAGAPGPAGPQGPVGAMGPMGPKGDPGTEGPRGLQGVAGAPGIAGPAGPMGLGLAFDFIAATTDTRIAMPANNHSPIYLVTTGRNNVEITLPAPASATSRFIVIQRVDHGRKVVVRPHNSEPIDGARQPIVMDDKYEAITLVTDGQQWVVLYRRQ